MPKIRKVQGGGQIFFCPGCQGAHALNLGAWKVRWEYNGDPDKPTFSPSLLVTYEGADADDEHGLPSRCHSFIRDGMIQFLGDCTHALKGQTVEIPEWPHAPGAYGGIEE